MTTSFCLYHFTLPATQSCVQFYWRNILRAWEKSVRAMILPQLDQTSLGVVNVR